MNEIISAVTGDYPAEMNKKRNTVSTIGIRYCSPCWSRAKLRVEMIIQRQTRGVNPPLRTYKHSSSTKTTHFHQYVSGTDLMTLHWMQQQKFERRRTASHMHVANVFHAQLVED
uniref:Uncharacterized protein n=1 Tax=Glossina pallidipes TaxID=7398 RepID=A0A1A9ZU16_GLOPL